MFKVSGMTCGHCANTVTSAVKKAAPATDVTVDLKAGTVEVRGEYDPRKVVSAIEAAGYKAQHAA